MADKLKPLEVKTINIASKAVTADKIADKAVENRHIKEGAVTPDKMSVTPASRPLTPPVDTNEIKDGAVTQAKLAFQPAARPLNPPIGTDEIRDGAITKAKLADGVISTAEIADGSVTTPKLASSSVTSAKMAAGAVRGTEIADGAVSAPKLSTDAVETAKIKDGAVTPGKLSFTPATRPLTPTVATDEIGDAQVTNPKIADRAVDWVKIALASINHELLYNLAPPTDGQILSFDAATGKFNWIAPPTGGGGVQLTLLSSQPLVFSENSMADVDQLVDLSTQIPVTATAVLLEMQLNAMSVPVGMEQILTVFGRRAGMNFGTSTIHFIWQNVAGNNNNAYKEATLAVDALRQLRVMITKSGVFTSTNIWIKGYIE
ncbi:MAG: hypothetical protein WC980_06830 [Candidatus Brocadiia bacterium]